MAIDQDDKTMQAQCADAVQEAVGFAARHGANEDELEWMAQRTGVPRAYLHRTVTDAHTVMDGLLSGVYKRLMLVLDHAAARSQDPLLVLERVYESHVSFLVRNPSVEKLLRHILGNPHSRVHQQVQKIMRVYEHEIAVIVQEAKSKGVIRNNVNVKAAATMFVGMVQAHLIRIQILGNGQTVRNEAREMLQLYMSGIRTAA
ncbi:MAG: hypothetical protein KDI47_05145 [Gammaproteobacteria bacterium]|nr:hypothetical protein [Gammaproteobacteria bacterium]MCP5407897.1 hypothetical protein [Chromatiaceae bacterium]